MIAAGIFVFARPLCAHHSFAAVYNIADSVVLKGTLSSFDWVNPHAFLTIAIRDDSGGVKLWRIEGGPIRFLKETGWSSEMLQRIVKSRDYCGYRISGSQITGGRSGGWRLGQTS